LKAIRGIVAMLCGLAFAGATWAAADEPDTQFLELLEYLGSWNGDDDEWHEFFDSIPAELAEEANRSDTTDRSTDSDSD